MLSKKEKIEKFTKQIEVISRIDRASKTVSIYCPNTGFKIEIENYNNINKNKELALTMYNLYLEEIL